MVRFVKQIAPKTISRSERGVILVLVIENPKLLNTRAKLPFRIKIAHNISTRGNFPSDIIMWSVQDSFHDAARVTANLSGSNKKSSLCADILLAEVFFERKLASVFPGVVFNLASILRIMPKLRITQRLPVTNFLAVNNLLTNFTD